MFCGKVKEFLSQKDIQFTERNVAEDESAFAELQKIGVLSTPVTVIEGEVVIGFDTGKLEQLLGLKKD